MPLPCTKCDFWVMMFDHDVKTVVMLNNMDPDDTVSHEFPSQLYWIWFCWSTMMVHQDDPCHCRVNAYTLFWAFCETIKKYFYWLKTIYLNFVISSDVWELFSWGGWADPEFRSLLCGDDGCGEHEFLHLYTWNHTHV